MPKPKRTPPPTVLANSISASTDHHANVERMMNSTTAANSPLVISNGMPSNSYQAGNSIGRDREIPSPDRGQPSTIPSVASPTPQAARNGPANAYADLDYETRARLDTQARLLVLREREAELAFREREAALAQKQKQGHTYGDTTLTGNARIIKGNVFSGVDAAARAYARSHVYGTTNASNYANAFEGDIDIDPLLRWFSTGERPDIQGDRE